MSDSVLQLGKAYQNYFGETFTVRSFKYYVSHLNIVFNDGKNFEVKQKPHLINEADSLSKTFYFTAPKGVVKSISFLLGIDSSTNVSGVQTGDLDPAKGMFWVWNTGYIMAKLEGSSPASKAPAKGFSYDVGGFKWGENAARTIILSLLSNTNHQSSIFIITADVGKWFYGKNNVKIGEQPMCHEPGTLAVQIADNYASMFSLIAQ